MIGAIVGDIVGSVYEFDGIKTKDFVLFADYHREKCEFTDDTVMTLAIAQALLDANENPSILSDCAFHTMQKLGHKYPHCEWGERFAMWLFLEDPCPYNSYGNGAAMRISPVAYAAKSLEHALELSDIVTGITHNHPEGIKGARATTESIWLARNGFTKEQIKNDIAEKYYPLNNTIDEIRLNYQFSETCQETVPQAIQCFLESDCFEDAIRNAVSLGGDSDTLAAITGGIAEAYYGVPKNLRDKALSYLTSDLKEILFCFEDKYCRII